MLRRGLQTLAHPQRFNRVLKLTDGSLIRVATIVPPPANVQASFTQLNLDSLNHPSWNPELRDRILLDDRGEVAKFMAKFESGDSFADFSSMAPDLSAQTRTMGVKKPAKKAAPAKKKK